MGAMPAPTPTVVVGFDLDLTLVDSRERIMSSYLRALHDVGNPVTREDLEPHLGIPLTHTIAAVAPAVDADALVLLYRHYYDQASAPATDPMPGALAAVRALREVGGRTVVVSAKFTPAAHSALAEAGLEDLVDALHGELFATEKATALIAEGATVYVGDHPGDMVAARAAGAVALGVATGANDEAALTAAGADEVLATLEAFPAWLTAHLADH